MLYAGVNGLLDDIPVESVKKFQEDFLSMLRDHHPDVLQSLGKEIKPEFEEKLKRLVSTMKDSKKYSACSAL